MMNADAKEHGDAGQIQEADRAEAERCQRELKESRKRLGQMETVFACAADGIFVAEPDGRIIGVNRAACMMLGCWREELLDMHPWDFLTSASRVQILDLIQDLRRGVPAAVQLSGRRKDSEQVVIDLRLTRCDHAGRDLIIVSCRDVTDQSQVQGLRSKRWRTAKDRKTNFG